jgi:hypothetical protein
MGSVPLYFIRDNQPPPKLKIVAGDNLTHNRLPALNNNKNEYFLISQIYFQG